MTLADLKLRLATRKPDYVIPPAPPQPFQGAGDYPSWHSDDDSYIRTVEIKKVGDTLVYTDTYPYAGFPQTSFYFPLEQE